MEDDGAPSVRAVTADERLGWRRWLDAVWLVAPWTGTGEYPLWHAVEAYAEACREVGACNDADVCPLYVLLAAKDAQDETRAEVRRLLGLTLSEG